MPKGIKGFQKGHTPWNKGKIGWWKGKHLIHSGSFKKGHKPFKGIEKTQFKKGMVPLKGFLGKHHTEEWKKQMSERMKGHRLSEEHKLKLRKVNIGRISPNKRKPMSQEQKEKIRQAHLRRWDEIGRKKYKRPKHINSEYIQWRKKVFERDNWTCQECGARNGNGKTVYLEAHHIKGWIEYPELRYKVDNGITLCKECHSKTKEGRRKICIYSNAIVAQQYSDVSNSGYPTNAPKGTG